MKIATKNGDNGMTSLSGGRRVPKSSSLIDFLGLLDELQAVTGWCKVEKSCSMENKRILEYIQKNLYGLMCTFTVTEKDLFFLEEEIENRERVVLEITEFVIPGTNEMEARLNFARTVCRRAERGLFKQKEDGECIPDIVLKYLNRLSDLFFVMGIGQKV